MSDTAGRKTKEALVFVGLILPAFLVLALVTLVPILQAMSFSVHEVDLIGVDRPFIGLRNFARVLRDDVFWGAVLNTLVYAGGSVLGQFVLAFLLAVLLNRELKGTVVLRMLALVPWITPLVVVGLLWRWMYAPTWGIVNQALLGMGLISKPIGWLGDMRLALPAVIVADMWKRTPFMMVMLLAGLQAVPVELYEAGRIDGTSWWSEFWHITIPSMRGTIAVVTLLGLIWNIQQITIIWLMTGGGPAYATQTLVVYVYITAFRFLDMGYASAVGILMMLLSLMVAAAYLRIVQGRNR